MHAQSLIAAVLMTTMASAAEPIPFHTAEFPGSPNVTLILRSGTASVDAAYDFDVLIGLTTMANDGSVSYRDPAIHPARVRCSPPATVSVGGADYAIGVSAPPLEKSNWKTDLWRTVCNVPVS